MTYSSCLPGCSVVKAQKETQKKIAQDDARARKALKKNKKSMIELVARKKALEKRAAAVSVQMQMHFSPRA